MASVTREDSFDSFDPEEPDIDPEPQQMLVPIVTFDIMNAVMNAQAEEIARLKAEIDLLKATIASMTKLP
jgi:hypothetical protein